MKATTRLKTTEGYVSYHLQIVHRGHVRRLLEMLPIRHPKSKAITRLFLTKSLNRMKKEVRIHFKETYEKLREEFETDRDQLVELAKYIVKNRQKDDSEPA